MSKVNLGELRQMQSLPLEAKIIKSQARIREWHEHFDGQVYVSFSGGKDSTVLLHLVRQLYPEVPAVFVDTGLEYPEIRQFVKQAENVIWLKPKMPFAQVVERYGYPVIGKRVAQYIHECQIQTARNAFTISLRLTGINRSGKFCRFSKIPDRWQFLVKAPFRVGDYCCDVIKKHPMNSFQTETGRAPFIGMMASDSQNRELDYLQRGCNAFDSKHPMSRPTAFWLEADVWEYLRRFNVPYSSIYDLGYHRTGCMFCMFGVHLEGTPNRFQRMRLTHPKQYDYCINKLGIGRVLDYIGVPYGPYKTQGRLEI